jgi:pantothenate kinase type III
MNINKSSLFIDIGNSSIKISIDTYNYSDNNNKNLKEDFQDSFSFDKEKDFFETLKKIRRHDDRFADINVIDLCYCSVRGNETYRIIKNIKKIFGQNVKYYRISYFDNEFFSFKYNQLSSYGEDRLALLYYSAYFFGRDAIISIDCGTAMTIDTLINGNYSGGFITAGFKLQSSLLNMNTRQLPAISLDVIKKYKIDKATSNIFGFSTEQSLSLGSQYAIFGSVLLAINNFCRLIKENSSNNNKSANSSDIGYKNSNNSDVIRIVITGGDGIFLKEFLDKFLIDYISSDIKFSISYDKNAVLKGLRIFNSIRKSYSNAN